MDKPKITYHVEEKQWELMENFTFKRGVIHFVIRAGFKTDLASIPRILWRIIAPFELSITAPLVHDYLYRNSGRITCAASGIRRKLSRSDTDKLFGQIMEDENVSWWRRAAAYRAVRMFAGLAWG